MSRLLVALGLLSFAAGSALQGQDNPGHADAKHVMVRPAAIQWGPAAPGLPPGAQMAVLFGDPTKSGAYVLRAKLPDGYRIPPHWHPSDELATVIQGALLVGTGDQFDAAKTEELGAGSFMRMPKTMHHFAVTKGETILQLHGTEPFEINYVNPADDPRGKATKK